jgi:hemerythrin
LCILRQGAKVCAHSAREKVPECVQNNEDSYAQIKKVITRQLQKINFHFIAENQ